MIALLPLTKGIFMNEEDQELITLLNQQKVKQNEERELQQRIDARVAEKKQGIIDKVREQMSLYTISPIDIIEGDVPVVIGSIKQLMNRYGIRPVDIIEGDKEWVVESIKAIIKRDGIKVDSLIVKAEPKYRNEVTGDEWSGKGMKPKWIKKIEEDGGNIEDYLIPKVKVENVDGKNTIEGLLIPIVKMESVLKADSVEFNG